MSRVTFRITGYACRRKGIRKLATDAASRNRFSPFVIAFGSYVRKCDMAAKSEKGPLETCLVVCTFGSYSLHKNWMLPSSPLHLSSFVFVLLLGPLRLREQAAKLGP